jgi:hypothetical protein
MGDGVIDELTAVGLDSDVGLDGDGFATERNDRSGDRLGLAHVTIGDDDAGPFLGEEPDNAFAEP